MKFRSLLFTPANKIDRVAKALFAGPDWVALDLEDGVDYSEKDQSRERVEKFFSQGKTERQNMAVRINSLSTIYGIRDINCNVWLGQVATNGDTPQNRFVSASYSSKKIS